MASQGPVVVLVRHGETEWTVTRRHTGSTDVPLTDNGRRQAELLQSALAGHSFELVLTSPLSRAMDTCRLAGLEGAAQVREELREWDYGEYEGVTTADIRAGRPDWTLWRDGCPGGESAADVGSRADRVLEQLRGLEADAAVFGHGHLLRVLAARWLGLEPEAGALLGLSTATISHLGHEREQAVLWLWNHSPVSVGVEPPSQPPP